MADPQKDNPQTVVPGFGCQVFDKDNLTDEEKARLGIVIDATKGENK